MTRVQSIEAELERCQARLRRDRTLLALLLALYFPVIGSLEERRSLNRPLETAATHVTYTHSLASTEYALPAVEQQVDITPRRTARSSYRGLPTRYLVPQVTGFRGPLRQA